jgi:hypothetical protein
MIVSAHRLNELLDAALHQLEVAEAQLDRVLAIREEGAAEERAAVVAWIKRDALQEDRMYPQMVLMGWIAQEIERGEHRRGEEP